jgi:predicted metalloprotease
MSQRSLIARRNAAVLAFLTLAVPASTALAAPAPTPGDDEPARVTLTARGDDEPVRITLTARDIEESNAEAAAAYSSLVDLWTRELHRIGAPFRAPRIVRYRGATRTQCGVMPASNAAYCFNNNTIYFDDVFLAAQAKITGRALRSDGDMAAVGIIAHEMGHAVAMQLGIRSRSSYENEKIADCLAGAFARHAESDGTLEHGDLDEAMHAMASAADPEFASTGDRRVDARLASRLARQAHGTREQRMQNFRQGFRGGGGACLAELR